MEMVRKNLVCISYFNPAGANAAPENTCTPVTNHAKPDGGDFSVQIDSTKTDIGFLVTNFYTINVKSKLKVKNNWVNLKTQSEQKRTKINQQINISQTGQSIQLILTHKELFNKSDS